MKLWDFIQEKLNILGRNESWLVDRGGLTQITVNRIKAGGVIKDSTKQKLAMCLGCTIGDINEALSRQEVPEPKAHDMDLLAKEIAPEVKEVVDDMLNEIDDIVGSKVTRPDPERIPVKESALKYNMEQLKEEMAMPEPGTLRVQNIKWYPDQPSLYTPERMTMAEYRDHLLGICLQQLCEAAEADLKDAGELYKCIGRALLCELMK